MTIIKAKSSVTEEARKDFSRTSKYGFHIPKSLGRRHAVRDAGCVKCEKWEMSESGTLSIMGHIYFLFQKTEFQTVISSIQ